jgi:hypothetical protein
LECGGAYVKLLASDPKLDLQQFFDKTSFSIMFGPDKCGSDKKYHFIIRYKHPKTGVFEEKHAKASVIPENVLTDGKTHLFTLGKLLLLFGLSYSKSHFFSRFGGIYGILCYC